MTNAIAEAQKQGFPTVKPSYGYYRQPNGWITVSPAAELDELHYRRKGWEPLTQYGRIEMTAEYAADHPLEALFMKGGAKELCREQIIESALHLNPPLIPGCLTPLNQNHSRHTRLCMAGAQTVVFPQITEADMVSYQCRFCNRPPFSTGEKRDQHETVMHKDEKSDIRTAESLAGAMIKGFGGRAPEPDETLSAGISEDEVQARIEAAVKAALMIVAEPSQPSKPATPKKRRRKAK